ncbi:MAG: hypothetical protein PHI63_02075 [Patescibacteria group bacterium]|nr:hypothetical protein [Patescibacteria group bacterium]
MYSTVHVATGAALGSFTSNAPLAFGIGMLSHFLLDRIPHNDPDFPKGKTRRELLVHPAVHRFLVIAAIDMAITVLMMTWILTTLPHFPRLPLISGAIGGMLPDVLFVISFAVSHPWLKWYNRFHENIHFDEKKIRMSLITGFATQIFVLALALRTLFR